jgi:citrate synthase
VEKRPYETIMVLLREGRLPKTFKIQPAADLLVEKILPMVEELRRSVESLNGRVARMEALSSHVEPVSQREPQGPA